MTDIKLTPSQQKAADLVLSVCRGEVCAPSLDVQIVLLTGPAGTGKTTTLKYILEELERDVGSVELLAPTGMAALRASQVTGRSGSTIHRWLYMIDELHLRSTGEIRFIRRDMERLSMPSSGVLIVDEWSMVSETVLTDLRKTALEHGLVIVGVGDPFQLPPVQEKGAPEPFDLPVTAKAELTEVLRQALQSPIIAAATAVRLGDVQEGLAKLQTVAKSQLVFEAAATTAKQGAVLVHRNASRHALNIAIREAYGWAGQPLQPGERLVCLKNDYSVGMLNGQLVTFERFTHPPAQCFVAPKRGVRWGNNEKHPGGMHTFVGALVEGVQVVLCLEAVLGQERGEYLQLVDAAKEYANKYEVGVMMPSDQPEKQSLIEAPLLHANLGWALTAHKMQGSEADDVIVVVEPSLSVLGDTGERRWLYTAITRAKRRCRIARWPYQLVPAVGSVTYTADIPKRLLAVGCGGDRAHPHIQKLTETIQQAGGRVEVLTAPDVDLVNDYMAARAMLSRYPGVIGVVVFEEPVADEAVDIPARTAAYARAGHERRIPAYFQPPGGSLTPVALPPNLAGAR